MKLACLGLLGLGAMGAVFFEAGPDEVIYPRQIIPLKFDHAFHLRSSDDAKGIEGAGLGCDDCHENIAESTRSSDRDIPNHDTCENCHDIDATDAPTESKQCTMCHADLAAKTTTTAKGMSLPSPNIIFSHAAHVSADVACVQCHKNVPQKGLATRDDYPTMDRCIECHEAKPAPTTCTTCHLSTPTGRVRTQYAEGQLKPNRLFVAAIHDSTFLKSHAAPAQRQPQLCDSCHQEKDCLQCHDGVGRDARYHPGDWIAVHSLQGRKDDFRCQSCHQLQKFCTDCHIRTGIAAAGLDVAQRFERGTIRRGPNEAGTIVPQGPHPMAADGWLEPASRNFHGFHAQRNIRACASCHQEQFCVSCHVSGFGTVEGDQGTNPHGPNPGRLKGNTASKRNARACLKCHSPSDPRWR